MSETGTRRRDPRYVEAKPDLSDWIQIRIAEQFGEQREANGLLFDLTPRAVRIAFPEDVTTPRFEIGTQVLLVFRFRDLATVTATASLTRVDKLPTGRGMVFFFDFIRDADREVIDRICRAHDTARRES